MTYLLSLLEPAPDEVLDMYAISTRVNNVRNDGPDLLHPISDGEAPLLPLPTFHGGAELVDVADREALYDVVDEAMTGCEPRSRSEKTRARRLRHWLSAWDSGPFCGAAPFVCASERMGCCVGTQQDTR